MNALNGQSQDLSSVAGQTTFLFDVTDTGVSNPSAATPSGGQPDALLDEGFYESLC